MANNALVIGTYMSEDVDSFDWWQDLPNLSDYDTVVLDTTRIFNFWSLAGRLEHLKANFYLLSDVGEQDEKIRANISLVRNKLIEMLEFPVSIHVLYHPEAEICQGPVYQHFPLGRTFVRTNDWCPISVDTVLEKGQRIYVKDDSYDEYFREFKGWQYYFIPDSLDIGEVQSYYQHRYKVQVRVTPIAANKVMKPIAIKVVPQFHRWSQDVDEPEGGWDSIPEKHGGSLVLLPTLDTYKTDCLIQTLLQRGKVFEGKPAPSWVSTLEMPGEAQLVAQITHEKKKLEAIRGRIEELEASLSEVRKHKRLLYADGVELQEICRSTLEEIGAKTKLSPVSDEFMVEIGGKEALIEVKGSIRNINKTDIGQLITDLGQLIMATEGSEPVKAILVGNSWRLSPIGERGKRDKPLFTREVVKIAETQDIGLLPTMELFKAYCKTLEHPECSSEVLNKLINAKGIIRF